MLFSVIFNNKIDRGIAKIANTIKKYN